MKNKIVRISLIICLLSGTAIYYAFAQSSNLKQFDFKGIPIGTALDDFKKMQHPDTGNPDHKTKSSTVVCTEDKASVNGSPYSVMLSLDETERQLGVKKCAWIDDSGSVDQLLLTSSGYGTIAYSFSFMPDHKDHTLRFYKFNGGYSKNVYGIALEALTKKFGKPAIDTSPDIGSKDKVTWKNATQTIAMSVLFDQLMDITVIDNDLMNIYEKADAARRASKNAAVKNPI